VWRSQRQESAGNLFCSVRVQSLLLSLSDFELLYEAIDLGLTNTSSGTPDFELLYEAIDLGLTNISSGTRQCHHVAYGQEPARFRCDNGRVGFGAELGHSGGCFDHNRRNAFRSRRVERRQRLGYVVVR
jgi:hypothetical protein